VTEHSGIVTGDSGRSRKSVTFERNERSRSNGISGQKGPEYALAWRLSNTMEAGFCVEALEEALRRFGPPEIFNTDQGSQFTSEDWTTPLKAAGVAISMDGKGRWIDNIFIERLWRSVKYEEVYLHAYASGSEARRCLTRYFSFYNGRRVHEALDYATPDEVYLGKPCAMPRAA
jgi:putative transposase